MRILTDFPRFPRRWKTSSGIEGEASTALSGAAPKSFLKLLGEIRSADVILVQGGSFAVLGILLFFRMLPFLRKPVVVVDLILNRPYTAKQKIIAGVKKILFKRIDHFIHYFRALEGYEQFYGISADRSSYIPFKANIFDSSFIKEYESNEEENYVYMAGSSLRDFDTFFSAIQKLAVPAAIARPSIERLRQHGARFTWKKEDLPKNLVMLDDDGSERCWVRNLCRARIVVIPILRDALRAAGISVYLDAMLLKKCVIISGGPGVSDILTEEAIIVPPENPAALVQAIRAVWENPVLRSKTARRGQSYAAALGGEAQLMERILERTVSWYLGAS